MNVKKYDNFLVESRTSVSEIERYVESWLRQGYYTVEDILNAIIKGMENYAEKEYEWCINHEFEKQLKDVESLQQKIDEIKNILASK